MTRYPFATAPRTALRGPPPGAGAGRTDATPATRRSRTSDDCTWLLCRVCGQRVTTPAAAVVRGGAHRHRFVNPAGIAFAIACFGAAPGAVASGPATAEATWFAGTLWRVALCRGCAGHLGWHYRGLGAPFFGLIRDRLRPA